MPYSIKAYNTSQAEETLFQRMPDLPSANRSQKKKKKILKQEGKGGVSFLQRLQTKHRLRPSLRSDCKNCHQTSIQACEATASHSGV